MKILLIEDDPDVCQFIKEGLEHSKYHIDICQDGLSGAEHALINQYDVIILDYLLPKLSGPEVLIKIRKAGCKIKVIMLTANDSIEDKVNCLNAGADDYMVKPFAFEELLARLRVMMRREYDSQDNILKFHTLSLNLRTSACIREDKEIALTTHEYMLLEYLMRHPNEVVTRTELLELVWGQDDMSDSNKIDVYIYYLRNKIDKGFEPPLLHTIRARVFIKI